MSDLVSTLKTISQRRLIDESKKLTDLNKLETVIKFFKSSSWKQIIKNDSSEKKTVAHSIAISYLTSVLGEDKFAFVDTELDFYGKKKLVVLHDKGGIIKKLSPSARSRLEKYEFANFKGRNKGYISAKPKIPEDPEDPNTHIQDLENEVTGASQSEPEPYYPGYNNEQQQEEVDQEQEEEQEEGKLDDDYSYESIGSGFVYRFPGVNTVKTNLTVEVNNKITFTSSYDTRDYDIGDTVTFDFYSLTSTSLKDTTDETLNFSLYCGETTNKTETYVLVIPPIKTPTTLMYNFPIEGEDYSVVNFGPGDQSFIMLNGTEGTLSLENFTSSGGNLLFNV